MVLRGRSGYFLLPGACGLESGAPAALQAQVFRVPVQPPPPLLPGIENKVAATAGAGLVEECPQ
jgi:hypothetical protein